MALGRFSRNRVTSLLVGAFFLTLAPSAFAGYVTVDLTPYLNLGFQNPNSWFINGNEFAPILGTTFGNQGSTVPFLVANAPDMLGNGGDNNFWFGLYGGPASPLSGAPLSITIPVTVPGVSTVYTLADNTFGLAGNDEYSITFTPASGTPLTFLYVGSNNTKDYNQNCLTTGCDTTPGAQYWFIDADQTQWLQQVAWTLPANFNLSSITFTQDDGIDGAIIAGLTLQTPTPEPATVIPLASSLLGLGFLLNRRRKRSNV